MDAKGKHAVRKAVSRAVKSGRLKKEPCEVCGSANSEAHHPDYSDRLNVRWMCRKHHALHHRTEKFKHAVRRSVVIRLATEVEGLYLRGLPFKAAMIAVVGPEVASGALRIPVA